VTVAVNAARKRLDRVGEAFVVCSMDAANKSADS